jgi:hypothetical protein
LIFCYTLQLIEIIFDLSQVVFVYLNEKRNSIMLDKQILSVLILASGVCGALEINGTVSDRNPIYEAVEAAKKEDPGLKNMDLTVCVAEDDMGTWESDLTKIIRNVYPLHVNLSLDLSDEVTSVESDFLSGCRITSFSLPDTVKNIGEGFLLGCTSLIEFILPNSIELVHNRFLSRCTALQQFDLPQSVQRVGHSFLKGCTALRFVKLHDSLTTIGDRFLQGCKNVEISLPLVDSQRRYYFCLENDIKNKSDEEKIAFLQLGYESKLYMNGEEITPKELYEDYGRVIKLTVPNTCALHLTMQKPPKRPVGSVQ